MIQNKIFSKKSDSLEYFKSYDVRGKVGKNFNEKTIYKISRAIAQHLEAKSVVIGFDSRESSPLFAKYAARGVMDAGSNALMLGMCGTEEVYWAVSQFKSCAGIEVTASHNPRNFNGLKMVKAKSSPLDKNKDYNVIKRLVETEDWISNKKSGSSENIWQKAREKYVEKILSFVDIRKFRKLKVLINCGNGAAGPTFDSIAEILKEAKVPLEFIRIDHEPDHTFPNGVPNPLLPENQSRTAEKVRRYRADLGVAFDGDFDRCFFFDENGAFVSGEYIVGILAGIFLKKEAGAAIVHDTRVLWNTFDIIRENGGKSCKAKTGHSFIKAAMRKNNAIYGGELSAHHYFRDFAYCDSGMIPWLLILELISETGLSLRELVEKRLEKFPSSGEQNYYVDDASAVMNKIRNMYQDNIESDGFDGLSVSFEDWRFNLRYSNTEPLIRLNIESKGNFRTVSEKLKLLDELIKSV